MDELWDSNLDKKKHNKIDTDSYNKSKKPL